MPSHLAAQYGQRQSHQFFRTENIKSVVAQAQQQAFVDRLHEVERIELGAQRPAKHEMGHDADFRLLLSRKLGQSALVPTAGPQQQRDKFVSSVRHRFSSRTE